MDITVRFIVGLGAAMGAVAQLSPPLGLDLPFLPHTGKGRRKRGSGRPRSPGTRARRAWKRARRSRGGR